jgi:hypothetical protein
LHSADRQQQITKNKTPEPKRSGVCLSFAG